MWYLSEEMIVFSLADAGCDVDVKSRIAARLVATARPRDFRPGKPEMNVNLLLHQQPDIPQLYDFVGERSWLLFHLLELDAAWLTLPMDQWEDDQGYQTFKLYVSNINVVNDAAERAVKDVGDFADYSQDPDRRDDVVQVVNSHRELIDFHHLTKDEIANI